MPYRGLGARKVTAAPDTTGNNTGFLTSVFDPATLAITVPYAEIYRAVVKGIANPPVTADIFINGFEVSYNTFGSGAEWDPSQPPIITPGDTVYFYWSIPNAGTAPITTLWFRHEVL